MLVFLSLNISDTGFRSIQYFWTEILWEENCMNCICEFFIIIKDYTWRRIRGNLIILRISIWRLILKTTTELKLKCNWLKRNLLNVLKQENNILTSFDCLKYSELKTMVTKTRCLTTFNFLAKYLWQLYLTLWRK